MVDGEEHMLTLLTLFPLLLISFSPSPHLFLPFFSLQLLYVVVVVALVARLKA